METGFGSLSLLSMKINDENNIYYIFKKDVFQCSRGHDISNFSMRQALSPPVSSKISLHVFMFIAIAFQLLCLRPGATDAV